MFIDYKLNSITAGECNVNDTLDNIVDDTYDVSFNVSLLGSGSMGLYHVLNDSYTQINKGEVLRTQKIIVSY